MDSVRLDSSFKNASISFKSGGTVKSLSMLVLRIQIAPPAPIAKIEEPVITNTVFFLLCGNNCCFFLVMWIKSRTCQIQKAMLGNKNKWKNELFKNWEIL